MTAPDRAAVEAAARDLGELATAWLDWFDGDQDWGPPMSMPERRSEIADHLRQVTAVLAELERLGQERDQDTRAVLDIVNGIERNLGVDPADELRNHFGNRDWRLRPKAADLAARDEREAGR